MPKGIPNKQYTPEFRKQVAEAAIQDGLSYREAARMYEVQGNGRIESWEPIYWEEGSEGLAKKYRQAKGAAQQSRRGLACRDGAAACGKYLLKNLQVLMYEKMACSKRASLYFLKVCN